MRQHKFLVMDVEIRGLKWKNTCIGDIRVKQWNLTHENATSLSEKIRPKEIGEMVECIRSSAKKILGVSTDSGKGLKGAWW